MRATSAFPGRTPLPPAPPRSLAPPGPLPTSRRVAARPPLVVGGALAAGLIMATCGPSPNELGYLRALETGSLTYGEPRTPGFDTAIRAVCDPDGRARPATSKLSRQPYLQQVDARGAQVMWTSDDPGPVTGSLFVDGQLVERVRSQVDAGGAPGAGIQHFVRFGEITPGAVHCYTLASRAGTVIERAGFRAPPARGKPFSFSVLGDLGKDTSDQRAVLEQLKRVESDLVLVAGDVAYDEGRLDELERYFFGVYAEMLPLVPFYPALGNHDYETDDGAAYFQSFALFGNGTSEGSERWYSLDWGDLHVAVLDTVDRDDEQRDWLARDLAASDARYKVVLAHHPPWSSGEHGNDEDLIEDYVPIFEAHGVDMMIAGHEHNYERITPRSGVAYLVTGGAGRGTRPVGTSDFTAFSQRVAHFVHLQVEPEHMTLYAIDATGAVFDTARVTARDSVAVP